MHTPELLDAHLNNFALCCFRDIADGDYMAARMAFRADLIPQALWSSEQAIEKYIKAILLLRRIESKTASHSPVKLLAKLEAGFKLSLSDEVREFIQYIDLYGPDRYFIYPYSTAGFELLKLDRTVWELRRYCISYLPGNTPKGTSVMEGDLKRIEEAVNHPPQKYRSLWTGKLEEVLSERKHPARSSLIWNNLQFGKSLRKTIRIRNQSISANSPLALYPEIFEEVRKYVFFPKAVIDEFDNPS